VKSILMLLLMMADTHTVVTDRTVDFSVFKTYVIRDGYPTYEVPLRLFRGRPAAADPKSVQAIRDAIRLALSSKGLTETLDSADLIVNFRTEMDTHPREFPGFINPMGQPAIAMGMVSVDLSIAESDNAIWHAHYIEYEDSLAKVEKRLPGDAKKLLAEFPPKKK
jgi:hypothetical protein